MRMIASFVLSAFTLAAMVPPVHAQSSHAAPVSSLESAVLEHAATAELDRDVVLRVLARPDVVAVAGDLGIDLRRAENAIRTLDGDQLTGLAAQARQAEQDLAGGQSRVTISTTLIIIALLVIILIIVAVD
jgi:hypothetical protein